MTRLAAIIVLLTCCASFAGDPRINELARTGEAINAQQAKRIEDLGNMLDSLARRNGELVGEVQAEQTARAVSESKWGYRVHMTIERNAWWVLSLTVLVFAAFIILKQQGLIFTGAIGGLLSVATTLLFGWLPASGWIQAAFDNLWWRKVKPRAEEHERLKARAEL